MDEQTTIQSSYDEEILDLRVVCSDLWRGLMKFWWVGVTLAVLLGSWQFYKSYIRYVPRYRTSATFTVQTQSTQIITDNGVSAYSFYYDRNTADQLAEVFPYILSSELLRERVAADLNLPSVPASVSASGVPGTNMITLTTTGTDPQMTYDVLLSVVKNYDSVANYIVGRTKLVMIAEPEVPTAPYNSLAWRNSVAKGILVGLLIGAAWICLYAVLRRTIRTKENVREILRQKCLGVIPQVTFKKYRNQKINTEVLLTNPHIGKDFLEAMRMIRSAVQHNLGSERKVVMITSTAPAEGKSVTAINMAAVHAQNQERVLLIDCDLRHSGILAMLKDKPMTVVGKPNESYGIHHVEDLKIDILSFVDARKHGHRILRDTYLTAVLNSVRDQYDLILIDTPPCGTISDATVVANVADAAVYVVRQDMVLQSSILAGLNALSATGTTILGVILTGASGGVGGYGSHYSYRGYNKYYRYGYSRKYGYGDYH